MTKENEKPNKKSDLNPIHFLNQTEKPVQNNKIAFKVGVQNQGTPGLELAIIDLLKSIFDPEIPVNIYDLGLIHNIAINKENDTAIEMTLTTPGCPVAQSFPQMIQDSIETIPELKQVTVTVVWDPPWSTDRLSEATKLQLGLL